MKKVLFVLAALLITTPAMGVVNITAATDGEATGVCRIEYEVVSETHKLRGVALDISVNYGNITAISDFKVGESGQSNKTGDPVKGLGIFPANFGRYISDPCNPDWGASGYTPAAENTDKGAAGTGIGTDRIIVELGSLYDPCTPGHAPDPTGTLCKITVSEHCTVSITKEETYRGGIVMEDSNTPEEGDNMTAGPQTCKVYVCTAGTANENAKLADFTGYGGSWSSMRPDAEVDLLDYAFMTFSTWWMQGLCVNLTPPYDGYCAVADITGYGGSWSIGIPDGEVNLLDYAYLTYSGFWMQPVCRE